MPHDVPPPGSARKGPVSGKATLSTLRRLRSGPAYLLRYRPTKEAPRPLTHSHTAGLRLLLAQSLHACHTMTKPLQRHEA